MVDEVEVERKLESWHREGRPAVRGTLLYGSPASSPHTLSYCLCCSPGCWQRSDRSYWIKPISCVQDCLRLMKPGKRWKPCRWSWRRPRGRWLSSRNSVRSIWSSLCNRSGKLTSSRRRVPNIPDPPSHWACPPNLLSLSPAMQSNHDHR